jgi:hypothetical protein
MSILTAARFFLVVPVVSHAMLWGFLAIVAGGCVAIAVDVRFAAAAMTPLLLLQLFAAASGFIVPARRGHYDLLLTSGAGRVSIGAAHWFMSVFPGVLAWLALAVTERAAGGEALQTPGTLFAIAFVSTSPWSLTMPLRRMSGAVLWLLVFFTGSAGSTSTLFPWVVVGTHPTGAGAVALAGMLTIAVGSVIAAIVLIGGMDVPLEASQ